jgi:predicted alpha-1,6-mannanase (GH76 family)
MRPWISIPRWISTPRSFSPPHTVTSRRCGRHRRPRPASSRQLTRSSAIIGLILVLAVCGLGFRQVTGHRAGTAAAARASRAEQLADNAEAAQAVAALQRRYSPVTYVGTRTWQSANAIGATIDYMRASGSRAYLTDLSRTYQAHHGRGDFLNAYYDDEGWWALTWIKAYDLTRNPAYLGEAKRIFADMTGGWDSTCGGGLWWSKARRYKNAIANEIFLQVAARLHARTPGDTAYEAWADREWAWFQHTGMLTGSHLVIDGLAHCKPDLSSPTWTYNQGMLIGGLVSLARITGHRPLLGTAVQIAAAVTDSGALSPRGILHDPCEPSCGLDGPLFKGIFMQNLQLLSDQVGGSYQAYMHNNALAVWDSDRRGDEFGLSWSGPFDSASTARQTAALDVLNTQVSAGLGG